MHTSGGRVSMVLNGINYSARGEITLDPSNISVQAQANQDGTGYRTVTPKLRTAECTFDRFVTIDDEPLVWDETILLLENIAFTFVETDGGVTHLLSNGCFVGSPGMNLANGEVSGVSIAAERYRTVR